MRIVQVIPDFGLGGIQKAGCVLAKGLNDRGHQAMVIARGGGPRYEGPDAKDAPHLIVPDASTETLGGAILDFRPDVVHIQTGAYDEPLVEWLAAAGANRPLVVSTPVFGRPPLNRETLKKTRTAVVGTYILHRLRHWLGMSLDDALRAGVAFTPVVSFQQADGGVSTLMPPEDRARLRAEFGLPADAEVLGRVGRNAIDKWSSKNVELIDKFLSRRPKGAWLSVGMPTGLGTDDLRQRWGDRFVSLPESSDYALLTRAYASMDLQAFFSPFGECFAATICEPAGLGLPTIAATNPIRDNGQSEQVVDGETGYLVAGVDDALARADALLDNPDELRKLNKRTFDYAAARWTPEVITDVLLQLYEAWLSDDPLRHPRMQAIADEARRFDETYLPRMLKLHAANPLARLTWSARLLAVRNWGLFNGVARVKRMLG